MNRFVIAFLLATAFCYGQTHVTILTDSTFKDAVIENYITTSNGGDNKIAFVAAWTNGSSSNDKRFFFEFDFSFIPAGANIDSAKLSLHKGKAYASANSHQGANSWSIRRVTQPWKEDSINWNNQPGSDTAHNVVIPATTSAHQDFPDIDITQLVIDVLDSGNFGFMARQVVESPYKRVVLATSDYDTLAKRPKLDLYYSFPCVKSEAKFNHAASGNIVAFTDSSGPDVYDYLWDFGDGNFSKNQNPTNIYAQPGAYTVCLVVTDSCDSDTLCKSIVVCESGAAVVQYSSNGLLVNYSTNIASGLAYWWDFGDGSYSSLTNPTHIYSTKGSYEVCVAVLRPGCGWDTSCVWLNIGYVGLSETAATKVKVYPNPANKTLFLENLPNNLIEIILYHGNGQEVYSTTQTTSTIPLNELSSGLYILHIQTEAGNFRQKVLIEK